jgi:hypothetical protein
MEIQMNDQRRNQPATTTPTSHVLHAAQIRAEAPGRHIPSARLHHLGATDFAQAIREHAPGRRARAAA